jgi:hypothetical protein
VDLAPELQRTVQHTRELERVLRLPRRTWEEQETAFADQLSKVLRKPGGRMMLRAIQAQALFEARTVGGMFGPIRVGGGKTLISLLAPFVMGSRRPLLLTRANLIEKTKRDGRELAIHWPVPNFIRIESYEKLGRTNHAELLNLYRPDLIVADEAHRLKNPKAAVTRRVHRYMNAHPETRVVAISGTITRKSLLEYAHLLKWCLKGQLPVPDSYSELEDWSGALDDTDGEAKVLPGALILLCNTEERALEDQRTAARRGFRRRLVETPGVVATKGDQLGASLTIQAVKTDMAQVIDQAFYTLRHDWKTPDDWSLNEPMHVAQVARQLAVGFYYKWDPRPPQAWIDTRKEWSQWCRYILTNNKRNLDSELQVRNAIDHGHYPDAYPALENWRRIEASFKPNTVPVWLDDSVIDLAARWAMTQTGIVWCEHIAFAERLARKTNLVYYGEGGLDRQGRYIENHSPGESLIASEGSNCEGRNLQYLFSRNLIISPSASGQRWEQLLGRTHRDGQPADEVIADVLCTCKEHAGALEKARRQALFTEATMPGQTQKLLYADIVYPSSDDVALIQGPRWRR